MTPESLLPWLFYLIAVVGAAAVYCLLTRARGGGEGRAALGSLLGTAALAGLIVWMIQGQKMRIFTWRIDDPETWQIRLLIENPLQGMFFYLFAAIALASAVMVVVHARPIYSALYFVLAVLAVGGVLLMLHAEFLAVALVLIYAGAILVTYVFVIMLVREAGESGGGADEGRADQFAPDARHRRPLLGLLAGFVLLAAIAGPLCDPANWYSDLEQLALQTEDEAPLGSARAMGQELYQRQLLGIELAGVLLVVGIVGAVAVARKRVTADDALPGAREGRGDG